MNEYGDGDWIAVEQHEEIICVQARPSNIIPLENMWGERLEFFCLQKIIICAALFSLLICNLSLVWFIVACT